MKCFCKVKHCRFPNFHTTKGHKCGKCGKYGHGVLECNNIYNLLELQNYHKEELPPDKWCQFPDCENKKFHTTQSHFCEFCKKNHENVSDCVIKRLDDVSNLFDSQQDIETIFNNVDNVFAIKYVGMGNKLFIRKKNGKILSMFMDQDLWGQYGNTPDLNHEPILISFIDKLENIGYIDEILESKYIECPICRTKNNKKDILEIKGLSEKCKVCFENDIDRYFSKCNHACICSNCLELLAKN
jgi:hypothetical protein